MTAKAGIWEKSLGRKLWSIKNDAVTVQLVLAQYSKEQQ